MLISPVKPTPWMWIEAGLNHFPDFSADRDIPLGERLAQAKTNRPITGGEPIDAEKISLNDAAVGSSQFEVVALFQARLVSHCKRYRWSEVKRSVLKLEYVGDNDE